MLRSRWLWTMVGVALLVGAYAAFGFRVLPGVLRSQAIDYVRRAYGRELGIGAVAVQPFKLQLEIRDLSFPDRDRQPMLALRRVLVDFEVSSLWRRAWVFRDLEVDGPAVRAVLRRDGTLNLADLVPPPAPGARQPASDAAPASLPSLWIESLALRAGSVVYVELARRRKAFARRFEPVGFTLRDFRTTPEGGAFRLAAQTGDGERFDWRGRFALAPSLASEGEFTIGGLRAAGVAEFLGDALPFEVSDGLIDLGGRYRVAFGADTTVDLQVPRLRLARLGLRARGVESDWVTVPTLEVADTTVLLPARRVTLGAVTLRGLRADAWVEPDGSVNLLRLVKPPAATDGTDPGAAPPGDAMPGDAARGDAAQGDAMPGDSTAPTVADSPPWQLSLARFELLGAELRVEDRMKAPVKRFAIAPLDLRVERLGLDLALPLPVTLAATINDHASLRVGGSVVPRPFAAELDVALDQARLQVLQPYVLPVADLSILGGTLGVAGRLRLAPPGGAAPALEFAGDASIDGFRSIDNALRQDLVSFRRLQVRKLRYTQSPDALGIDAVRLVGPYARVIIGREQVLNIAAVLDPRGTAAEIAARRARDAARAAETRAERRARERAERRAAQARQKAARLAAKRGAQAAPVAAPRQREEAGLPVRIRELRIDDGRMNFSDLSIQPNFAAEVVKLGGTITGLSSAFSSRATIDLRGQVDEFSPVTIGGTIQPFAYDRFTDVSLRFENISLPVLNPYSGRFAGYNIAKGKLTTDLRYQVDRRKLNAAHRIRIDQLEWGEASAAKGEATLPVKFATALLKDRNGVIEFDVPVTGTLDDPRLRIGPIVWRIIRNLVVKAVTAPFALLGALFAGAEEAQFVDFAPGAATLEPAAAGRLAALARGLGQKQGIALDVPIAPLPALDAPALLEHGYLEQRARALAAVLGRKDGDASPLPEFDALPMRQRVQALERMLRDQGGDVPKPPPAPEPPAGASRAEVRAAAEAAQLEWLAATARRGVVLADDALAVLGRERAAAVQRALLAAGELEPSRVFLVNEGKVGTEGGNVRLQLALK